MSAPARSVLASVRDSSVRVARSAWPFGGGPSAHALPRDVPVDAALFAPDVCRNCGAMLTAPHCGACGQKKVARLGHGQLRTEAWESYRLFDMGLVHATLRVIAGPGTVAREYVLGARKRHMHPLKLLLVMIGFLLLVQSQVAYLDSADGTINRAMALVKSYAKWSFSVGILAILAASKLTMPRRLGYNLIEHLVLATYTHALVIGANVLNLMTLLAMPRAWLPAHKQASLVYMTGFEAAIVAVAFAQFFNLGRRDAWRLALAVLAFLLIKHALLYGYGRVVLKLVLAQLQ